MLKSCPYCGRMHPVGYECQKKPRRKWYPKQRGRIERFRSTAAWQKKREEILMRDHYLCRVCLDVDHRINNRGLSVHHITPLGKDYDARLEEENLITLCSRHHDEAEHCLIPAGRLRELAQISPRLPDLKEPAKP